MLIYEIFGLYHLKIMQPTVLINQHRQTAIIVATCGKKLLIVKLGKGKLTVASLLHTEIQAQGYVTSDYSPTKAARSYLKHGAGVSKRAQRYLQEIAKSECSEVLTFT